MQIRAGCYERDDERGRSAPARSARGSNHHSADVACGGACRRCPDPNVPRRWWRACSWTLLSDRIESVTFHLSMHLAPAC